MDNKFTTITNAFITEKAPEVNTSKVRISTSKCNRNGIIYNQLGINTKDYEKNPIVSAFHDETAPSVGRGYGFNSTPDETVGKIEWQNPQFKSWYIDEPVKMRAVSITTVNNKVIKNPKGYPNGTIYVESCDLADISAVLIGADPDALVLQNKLEVIKNQNNELEIIQNYLGITQSDKVKIDLNNQLINILQNKLDNLEIKNYDEEIIKLTSLINNLQNEIISLKDLQKLILINNTLKG